MKACVFIATSIDGFIAKENGDLDWLDKANECVPKSEDCGYHAFMADVDVLIMGRKSFEKVLSFGRWPYEDKKIIVLSHNPIVIPERISQTVSHANEPAKALYERLEKEGFKKIYIDGGVTISHFLNENLIDEIIITTIPVLLGKGISFVSAISNDVTLTLINSQAYSFGYIQNKYSVDT